MSTSRRGFLRSGAMGAAGFAGASLLARSASAQSCPATETIELPELPGRSFTFDLEQPVLAPVLLPHHCALVSQLIAGIGSGSVSPLTLAALQAAVSVASSHFQLNGWNDQLAPIVSAFARLRPDQLALTTQAVKNLQTANARFGWGLTLEFFDVALSIMASTNALISVPALQACTGNTFRAAWADLMSQTGSGASAVLAEVQVGAIQPLISCNGLYVTGGAVAGLGVGIWGAGAFLAEATTLTAGVIFSGGSLLIVLGLGAIAYAMHNGC